MSESSTTVGLFSAALAAEPARPFLIYYDDGLDARVELSLTTLDNWVSKTGNLLTDDLGAEAEQRLALALPPHWVGVVWLLAGWTSGMVVDLDGTAGADVAVVGPGTEDSLPDAGELVVCGRHPLGGRYGRDTPAGAWDYGAEVLGHGDRFTPLEPPRSERPALVVGGHTYTMGDLVTAATERAVNLGLQPGSRTLLEWRLDSTLGPDFDLNRVLDLVLAPLAARASVVLVADPDPDRRTDRIATERVTHPAPAPPK